MKNIVSGLISMSLVGLLLCHHGQGAEICSKSSETMYFDDVFNDLSRWPTSFAIKNLSEKIEKVLYDFSNKTPYLEINNLSENIDKELYDFSNQTPYMEIKKHSDVPIVFVTVFLIVFCGILLFIAYRIRQLRIFRSLSRKQQVNSILLV